MVLGLSLLVKSTTIEVTGVEEITDKYSKLFCFTQIYAIFICVFFLIMQLLHRNELRAVQRLNQNRVMWEQRQRQYEVSKETIDLINRECHDMKHQIAALAQSENIASSKQTFIKNVQNMIEVYDSGADTGNEALDTILMEKGLYCRLHDIEWVCVADGKLLSFVDMVDLYTIMGNALDNAVEAVEKCVHGEWKTIAVRIWKRDLFAVIQIENSYFEELTFVGGMPRTTKKEKENHGFGIESISAIAEKYRGTIHITAENGFFTLTIVLPLP